MSAPPVTVRAKLAALALAGLVLMGLMAVLLLKASGAATDVVQRANDSHERVQAFARLQYAGERLQTATYDAVRARSRQGAETLDSARRDFKAALAAVAALPVRDPREARAAGVIQRQGLVVLDLFSEGSEIVRRVDARWRQSGSLAALREIQDLSEPYVAFSRSVSAEVAHGDAQLGEATQRAISLQQVVTAAALISLALGLALSMAVFLVLLTRLGPGLKQLEIGARAFGRGELGHRIGLGGRDELAQLSTLFDSMAEQLAEKQRALQDLTTHLEQAVAERTAELETANAALSAEDERLRAFLADVSHELRTPLTIIRGEVQVALRAGERVPSDPIEVYERILQQTRGLSCLVDDLFLIARAEAGGLPLNLQPIEVDEIITGIAQDFSTLACEQGATVVAHPDAGARVMGDPDRLRQILAALIDNALRHTRPGVNVVLESRDEAGQVAIRVSDDGPGVDSGIASDLFGRFRRGPTRGDGSGLGLTVVRALTEAQGGSACLEPGAAGGACAVIRLPKPRSEAQLVL